jgi:CspA family cold shock protein
VATGTVKTIHRERGFGFLVPDGGGNPDDLFFHHTAVADGGFDQLREGQQVSYEEGADPRNPSRRRAVNVQPAADEAEG